MEIKGYKAFKHDMFNNYGDKFEEGKTYKLDGEISFGVKGRGFHMCKRIEDTFRYVEDDDVKIAKVTGRGKIVEGFDHYNEYYDMYCTSEITIDHIMSREEVIKELLKRTEEGVCRFLSTGFKLTDTEVALFRLAFSDSIRVNQYIDYYVYDDKEVFLKEYKRRKVNKYGHRKGKI
jgi:hypothetical protein